MDIPSVLQEFHGGRSFRSSVLHGLLWTYRSALRIAVKDTWKTIPLLLRRKGWRFDGFHCFFSLIGSQPYNQQPVRRFLSSMVYFNRSDVIPQSLVMVVVVVSMGGQCDPLSLPRLWLWSHTSLWFPSRKRLSAEPNSMWSFGRRWNGESFEVGICFNACAMAFSVISQENVCIQTSCVMVFWSAYWYGLLKILNFFFQGVMVSNC